ncbi:MAG: dockerin type I domain-containing protein, partial [Oscillospiraceae bacterium]
LTAPIVSMFIDPMEDPGHGLWRQSFDVMSSSLLGKIPAKTTYMLTAERGGNLTYTRVALVLDTADTTHYDATTKTFRLLETILLKAGDINGDGMVKAQDEFILTSYLQNPGYYTTQKAPGADPATDEGWKRSIYNPNTEAYRCDLNGNGQVDWGDHYDLYMNQNVTTEDYKWKINLAGDMVLPYGLDVAPIVRGAVGPMADLPPEGETPEEVPGPEGPPTEEQVPETPENPTPEHPLPETPPTEGEVILPETPACPEEIPALPPVPEEGETPNQEPGPNP